MNKKKIMKIFFLNELIFFTFFYYYGAQGMQAVFALKKENYIIEEQIQKINQEIAQLTYQIDLWKKDSFYKEKLAREQLHMIKTGEEVYLT